MSDVVSRHGCGSPRFAACLLMALLGIVGTAAQAQDEALARPCESYDFTFQSYELGIRKMTSGLDVEVRVVNVATDAIVDERVLVDSGPPFAGSGCGWVADVSRTPVDPSTGYVRLEYDTLYRIEIYTGGVTLIASYEYYYGDPDFHTNTFYSFRSFENADMVIRVGSGPGGPFARVVSNYVRVGGTPVNLDDYFQDANWIMPYNLSRVCQVTGCNAEQLYGGVPFIAPAQSYTPGFPRSYTTTQGTDWNLPQSPMNWSAAHVSSLRFAPGTRLTVRWAGFNVQGVTLTASNVAQGWRGVWFNPGSTGSWSPYNTQPTVVERVAGDVNPICFGTPCSSTAAVTVDNASPVFNGVVIREPVPNTYLHGLRVTGTSARPYAGGLTIRDMSGSGVYAHASAKPRLEGHNVVLTANAEPAILTSGSGTQAFLSPVNTVFGLRGPRMEQGPGGAVAAVALGRVTFGAWPNGTGLGFANLETNQGRGLYASGGGDIDAGTATLHSRNRVFDNGGVSPTGNGLAIGSGSTVLARCNWWGGTQPAAFRVAAQSGATFDVAQWLTGDPYADPNVPCIGFSDPNDGRTAQASGRADLPSNGMQGEGGEPSPADRLSAAVEMRPVPAVAHLMALVRDHPEAPEAASALTLAGLLASAEEAPPGALVLLAGQAESEYPALRQAAHQALVVAYHSREDLDRARASAAALVAMGGEAARVGHAAEVFVTADAGLVGEALAALAALEADAPGSDEAAAARAHLLALGVDVPEARATLPETMTPVEASGTAARGLLSLAVHPNPATHEATLSLMLPGDAAVRVTVHDLLGREVAVVQAGSLAAGSHAMRVTGLAPGVYTVRAVGAGAQATARMTVVR